MHAQFIKTSNKLFQEHFTGYFAKVLENRIISKTSSQCEMNGIDVHLSSNEEKGNESSRIEPEQPSMLNYPSVQEQAVGLKKQPHSGPFLPPNASAPELQIRDQNNSLKIFKANQSEAGGGGLAHRTQANRLIDDIDEKVEYQQYYLKKKIKSKSKEQNNTTTLTSFDDSVIEDLSRLPRQSQPVLMKNYSQHNWLRQDHAWFHIE